MPNQRASCGGVKDEEVWDVLFEKWLSKVQMLCEEKI
jgi:hypothetical protein